MNHHIARQVRTLEDHKVEGAPEALHIKVFDEPGAGGAHHLYEVSGYHSAKSGLDATLIEFQDGPIKEAGVNGLTHEALLAIVADRLRSFQAGQYRCQENHDALVNVESALFHLKARTQKRLQRGVEGTHQV